MTEQTATRPATDGGVPDAVWNVLVVDDEPDIHTVTEMALKRRRWRGRVISLTSVYSAAEAREQLKACPDFSVALVDVVMESQHAGLELCQFIRNNCPTSLRIVLRTGQAGVAPEESTLEGYDIDSYLHKPEVTAETLYRTVRSSLRMSAEVQQLEQTVLGSVEVFTEILGFVDRDAFGRAARIKETVAQLTRASQLPHATEFELAAMLSQLGWLGVASETLEKLKQGQRLTASEAETLSEHPKVAAELLGKVPGLHRVGQIVGLQTAPPKVAETEDGTAERRVALGAQMLRIALEYDELQRRGKTRAQAVAHLQNQFGEDAKMIGALAEAPTSGEDAQEISVEQLKPMMIFDEDIRTIGGAVLVEKGRKASHTTIALIRRFAKSPGVVQPLRVVSSA